MTAAEFFISPFADYAFMRRALGACVILAVGGAPVGVFMTLRRLALAGDALSHAILPGAAVAFLLAGLSLAPMTLGGFAAGVAVALLASLLTRATQMKEDISLTLVYLLSIALGTVIVSARGGNAELLHLLFGNILAIGTPELALIASTASVTLLGLAFFTRGLVLECFDPGFLRATGKGRGVGRLFLVLVILNLVAAFQALGTLMALGLMLLPSIAARFWTQTLARLVALAMALAVLSSYAGLLLSWHANLPAGASVVLSAGALALFSALFGAEGSLRANLRLRA